MAKLSREEEAARRAFLAAQRQNLRARAGLLASTDLAVRKRLQDAAVAIAGLLAQQPADWRVWQLGAIQPQVQQLIDALTGDLQASADEALDAAWTNGVAAVDAPLASAGIHVGWQLPMLDTSVLTALKTFTAGRILDLSSQALGRIDRAIGLTVLGATTPNEAVQSVQAELGQKDSASLKRARRIVHTSLGEAYALAEQQRLVQSAERIPDLQKQWLRSGKIFSRWNHDAADGQVVPVAKPFVLPAHRGTGTVTMMHPHDPTAPAGEIINCGCTHRAWLARFGLPPGGTPFSDREIERNPLKKLAKAWLEGKAKKPAKAGKAQS